MNILFQILPRALRDAATAAFHDNSKREQMSAEDREKAAQAYEKLANLIVVPEADLNLHRFEEGTTVYIKQDFSDPPLGAGTSGVVSARYATEPPAYEVTFELTDGKAVDITMEEDELAAAPSLEMASEAALAK